MQPVSCALLVSTYNWPQALNLVIKSALFQSHPPNEILIADDGSKAETRELIERFQQSTAVPIRHTWQEDLGFRKAKILNKALAGSAAEYVIQVDGDCIMHPHFVADHLRSAEAGAYLFGSRVNILPEAVAEVLGSGETTFGPFSGRIKNKTRNLRIPFLAAWYRPSASFSRKFRGCNVSFWRKDFLAVNGYNEQYEGWGREDSDLVIRMGNLGVRGKRLRYGGIVYHLFHPTNSDSQYARNDQLHSEVIANKVVRIADGVDQYL